MSFSSEEQYQIGCLDKLNTPQKQISTGKMTNYLNLDLDNFDKQVEEEIGKEKKQRNLENIQGQQAQSMDTKLIYDNNPNVEELDPSKVSPEIRNTVPLILEKEKSQSQQLVDELYSSNFSFGVRNTGPLPNDQATYKDHGSPISKLDTDQHHHSHRDIIHHTKVPEKANKLAQNQPSNGKNDGQHRTEEKSEDSQQQRDGTA